MTLPLRPHHGMCIRGFVGKGYDDTFAAHMCHIVDELDARPAQPIRLVCAADMLCEKCPHNRSGQCESAGFVTPLDTACLRACGLHDGDVLPWKDYRRIIDIFRSGLFERLCSDCEWFSLCQHSAAFTIAESETGL